MDAEAEAFALSNYFSKIVAEYKKICRRTRMCPDNGYLKAEEARLYGRILEFKSKYRPFIKERKNSLGRFDADKYLEFHRISSRRQLFAVPDIRMRSSPGFHARGCMCCEPRMQHPGGYQSHGAGVFFSDRDMYSGPIKRLRMVSNVCPAPNLLTSTEEACRTITLPKRHAPLRKRDPEGAMQDGYGGRRYTESGNTMQARPGIHVVESARENIDYLNRVVIKEFYDRNDYRKPLALFLRHRKLADLKNSKRPFEGFGLDAEHTFTSLDHCDVDEMYRRCDMFLNEMLHLACSTASSREDKTLTPGDFALVLRTAYDIDIPETLMAEPDADVWPVHGRT